jgi:methylenetetrahydrofolate reductase (NADPH)
MLRFLHDRIPGVEVDDATFARMEHAEGEAARSEGIRVAADVITALRRMRGISGVHIMAPGWEAEGVPRVVDAAGLGTARVANS